MRDRYLNSQTLRSIRRHVFQDIRGFDSVRAVQFILALESALNIVLDEEDVDTMHTMGDMLATLRAKTRAMAREA